MLLKIWAWQSFGGLCEQLAKVFSVKTYFPPICKRFLTQKFPAIQYMYIIGVRGKSGVASWRYLAISDEDLASYSVLLAQAHPMK